MDPQKLISDWMVHITPEASDGRSDAESKCFPQDPELPDTLFPDHPGPEKAAPGALDGLEGLPGTVPAPNDLDSAQEALEAMKPILARLTGLAYIDYLQPVWEAYEKSKDPADFIRMVAGMRQFVMLVKKVDRLLPVFRLKGHIHLATLERGLEDGALADTRVRKAWESLADQCWREFLQNLGPFAKDVAAEFS